MGFVPMHVPARHESVCVQALPSSQLVPSTRGSGSQRLALSLHTPSLHWLAATAQLRGDPPQTPLVQESFTVQKSPSLQSAPSAFGGLEQAPVFGSQTPAAWHESRAVQRTRPLPPHPPARQVSGCVQALPSSQMLPFGFGGVAPARVSGVEQAAPSLQAAGALTGTLPPSH